MKKTIFIALLMIAVPAQAGTIVRTFTGTGNETTATFTVESPWIIDWRLDGDYDTMVAIDVTLIEARSGRYVGRVLRAQRRGNGVRLFHEGGTYQLKISSSLARWRFKIEQLTPEEAEDYKPRPPVTPY